MTDGEYGDFAAEVRRLATVLRLRANATEVGLVTEAYFKALRAFPLRAVIAGAEVCIQRAKYFPKPAEWLEAIPRRQPVQVRMMTAEEAREYRRAELARYEGPVCACEACREAGVTAAQPIRFVPDFDADDQEVKAFDPLLQRTVTTGHWIHGEELTRWYAAKANFYAKFHELCAKKSIKKETKRKRFDERLDEIFKPRPKPIEPEDAGA